MDKALMVHILATLENTSVIDKDVKDKKGRERRSKGEVGGGGSSDM
jgi:hypothetical protein